MLKIKLLRMSKGLSQWQLSQLARISQGRLSMVERGHIDPTVEERARLAHVLNANPATLFRAAVRSGQRMGVSQEELVVSA